MESNRIIVVGRLLCDLKASYNVYGETFFDGIVAVKRMSGTVDYLQIVIPATAAVRCGYDKPWELRGRAIRLTGSIKTYNRKINGKKRHYIILKVSQIEEANDARDENSVELIGNIRMPPVFRETPFGREICEFMVSVDRSYWKSDYIPCIAWGETARRVGAMDVGQTVEIVGRFQSREYVKTLENGEKETRTAYEVSAKTVCTHEVEKRLITEPEKEK